MMSIDGHLNLVVLVTCAAMTLFLMDMGDVIYLT